MRSLIVFCSLMMALLFVTTSNAALVFETEPNDDLTTAQNIDPFFSLDFDNDIGTSTINTSTSIPHVTVNGTGESDSNNLTYDVYSFTVASPGLAYFDIDYGYTFIDLGDLGNFDSYLRLYNQSGSLISFNDDSYSTDNGTVSTFDSFVEYNFKTTGTYYIEVGRFPAGNPVSTDATYLLHISIENHPLQDEPIPTLSEWGVIIMSILLACSSIFIYRRKWNS